ncbi:hypothetical protein AwDysgo_15310 [Bacteroidales bacterium]|nr:hypothetical protein AwDysgo_15310 [Bacteroidales bacterium]
MIIPEQINELKVVKMSARGAVLSGGEEEILLRDAPETLQIDDTIRVFVEFDDKGKLFAHTNHLFCEDGFDLFEGKEVDLICMEETKLGFSMIINQRYTGLLYHSDVFSHIESGDKMRGYIKTLRSDELIDLCLNKQGYLNRIDDETDIVIKRLKEHNDTLPYNDKSQAEDIYSCFGMSKKAFKRAIGKLYKQKHIRITDKGIEINT